MTSSSFESSELIPCEITPLGIVSSGGPVPQAKKKSSRSFSQVVVLLFLVCLGITFHSRLPSLASSSSVVDQSVSKSVNNVNENDRIVFTTASLAASETKTSFRQVAKGKSTIDTNDRSNDVSPTASLTEVIDSPKFLTKSSTPKTLKFPRRAFDYDKRKDASHMIGIRSRCNNAHRGQTDPDVLEILACLIYESVSDQPSEAVNMALGTIKTDADILKILFNGGIKVKDVSSLFEDYAMAVMIDKGCFTWSSEDNKDVTSDQQQIVYNSENDYSEQVGESSSIDVSASDGFGPVTAYAGYLHAQSSSSTSSSNTKTAVGYNKYFSSIGSIQNICLRNKENFSVISNLLRPEWTKRWGDIRDQNPTSVAEILDMGDDFEKVANGGFYMPHTYNYEATLTYTVTATYSSSDASQAIAASNGIDAGLNLYFRGGHGSAETQINNAMYDRSSQEHHYTGTFESHFHPDRDAIDPFCLLSDTCLTQLEQTVDLSHAKGGLSNMNAHASSISSFVSLDTIIKWYFDDSITGLPDLFPAAVDDYLKYNSPGAVCWGYDFVGYNKKNKHNCWTTNKNMVPIIYPLVYSRLAVPEYRDVSEGVIVSPHPPHCCNQCKKTELCDSDCQRKNTLIDSQRKISNESWKQYLYVVAPLGPDECRYGYA